MLTNLPTDLLRAFLTVVDLESYTRAAEALGRSQPAISLQIRRLEGLLGTRLLTMVAGQVRLTEAGMALGPYARQMLRLNDDIVVHFARETLSGWIRVGLPTDFSHAFLTAAIAHFAANHPAVRIEVQSLRSDALRADLAADRLDIAVAVAPSAEAPFLVTALQVTPIWAVAEGFDLPADAELPILRHPDPCEYAERMRQALRQARRGWRSLMVASDVAGLQAGILAGIGASALTPATLLPGMRAGTPEEGFPPLQPLRVGLFYKHVRLSRAGHGLAQWLMAQVDRARRGGG